MAEVGIYSIATIQALLLLVMFRRLGNATLNNFGIIILFFALFMTIAPVLQFASKVNFWGRPFPDSSLFIKAQLLSLFFLTFYLVCYHYSHVNRTQVHRRVKKHRIYGFMQLPSFAPSWCLITTTTTSRRLYIGILKVVTSMRKDQFTC